MFNKQARVLGHPSAMWRLMGADILARSAYQVGKTPLLPIYAATLGASDLVIGYVVSISTLTGLLLKPVIGALSDRTTRRAWLLLGLILFAGIPFLYQWVERPEELYFVRLLHGTATAIFGPVSLAYIAEMGASGRAERLGIFGMSRSASYLVAPVIGASLLTVLPPEHVFTIIGLVSCVALLPALRLPETQTSGTIQPRLIRVFDGLLRAKAVRLVALIEMITYVATYALKAFLPIYALRAMELDLILIGLFFTLQEAAHLIVRPFAGRLADRIGTKRVILFGLVSLAVAFAVLGSSEGAVSLTMAATGIGIGLGMILPATLSMLTAELRGDTLGVGMGVLGALRNFAKVLGPVLAGVILSYAPYQSLFQLAACLLAATALSFGLHGTGRSTTQVQGS